MNERKESEIEPCGRGCLVSHDKQILEPFLGCRVIACFGVGVRRKKGKRTKGRKECKIDIVNGAKCARLTGCTGLLDTTLSLPSVSGGEGKGEGGRREKRQAESAGRMVSLFTGSTGSGLLLWDEFLRSLSGRRERKGELVRGDKRGESVCGGGGG